MTGRRKVFIVGCGYVGRRLGHALSADHDVFGLVSSTKRLKSLRAARIEPLVLDIDRARRGDLSPVWIRDADLIYLVPPPHEGESDTRLDRFLQLLTERPTVFVYASTTAVYGDLGGGEATESTPVNPNTLRAQRRISAEHMTRVWCTENEVRRVVLRLPAIYGPGRLPLERLQRGEPCIREADSGIVNRIHVDDLIRICLAVLRNPDARGVYNASDGNAHRLTDYLKRVAAAAGLPPPPEVSIEEAQLTFTPERLSFMESSRRIGTQRLREELRVELQYTDVDAGIRASLEEEAAYRRRSKNIEQ